MKDHRIQTFTGKWVDPLVMRPEEICIEDIAHSLSMQCRFSGHTRSFYSVCEHSILLSRQVVDRRMKLEALLHDASEAYLTDVPGPLKRLPEFDFYREAEKRLQSLIFVKYGLDAVCSRTVDLMDKMIIRNEALSPLIMYPPHKDWELPVVGLNVEPEFTSMPPEIGEAMFLETFNRLFYAGVEYDTDFRTTVFDWLDEAGSASGQEEQGSGTTFESERIFIPAHL